jgi:ADP-ribose pyrophosphatase
MSYQTNIPFKTLSTKTSWENPFYRIQSSELLCPNGDRATYHVVTKGDAVFIVPVTTANEIVLIRQYRFTVGAWCWEVPAGSIKPAQTPLEAAAIELREEIGGSAEQWQLVSELYTMNGICNEKGYFYLATGVTMGETAHEPIEMIEIHPTPIPTALHMARTGQIEDGKSALALLLCEGELLKISKT